MLDPWYIIGWLCLGGTALVLTPLAAYLAWSGVSLIVAERRARKKFAADVRASADVDVAVNQLWYWVSDSGDAEHIRIRQIRTVQEDEITRTLVTWYTPSGRKVVDLDAFNHLRRSRPMALWREEA
jgi:hypothetical protein